MADSKKAFEFKRDSIWKPHPIDEIGIIGGKSLPPNERGPLDTDVGDTSHHLFAALADILEPLDDAFVANVGARGVRQSIEIIRINGKAYAVTGRKRLRAARIETRKRAKAGDKRGPVFPGCTMLRDDQLVDVIAARISENEARTDKPLTSKIASLKQLLAAGASEDYAAMIFKVEVPTIRGWLAFEDHAIDDTKKAAATGRLRGSVAAELARIHDPEKQAAALAEMLSAPGTATVGSARRAARKATGRSGADVITSKKVQKRLLVACEAKDHTKLTPTTAAWWEGGIAFMKAILGVGEVDRRIKDLIEKAKEAPKADE